MVWGWGIAQYPYMLRGMSLTVASASSPTPTLVSELIVSGTIAV